jgi:hypothetical protein
MLRDQSRAISTIPRATVANSNVATRRELAG